MQKGVPLLVKRLKKEFQEENEAFYSENDYREAERKFIKLCLRKNSSMCLQGLIH
jgi:hypothetical protein